uniref:Gamma-secretase-activating protein C-terminal domain-containing protein n=1 Tax=Sphaeramia orbicularis TaxID=375764 RepID=A0A673BT06_9TELE
MFRILEAARSLCLPLPPGYNTLLAVFAVRCLPHPTFLQYIDHKLLQLTETFVSRPMEQTIYHMWDHPVSSASISRDYVRTLLEKHNKNKSFSCVPAANPFEEQENVDARFVEETALKQTLIQLGFEEK